jgi:hypothetical protein
MPLLFSDSHSLFISHVHYLPSRHSIVAVVIILRVMALPPEGEVLSLLDGEKRPNIGCVPIFLVI